MKKRNVGIMAVGVVLAVAGTARVQAQDFLYGFTDRVAWETALRDIHHEDLDTVSSDVDLVALGSSYTVGQHTFTATGDQATQMIDAPPVNSPTVNGTTQLYLSGTDAAPFNNPSILVEIPSAYGIGFDYNIDSNDHPDFFYYLRVIAGGNTLVGGFGGDVLTGFKGYIFTLQAIGITGTVKPLVLMAYHLAKLHQWPDGAYDPLTDKGIFPDCFQLVFSQLPNFIDHP